MNRSIAKVANLKKTVNNFEVYDEPMSKPQLSKARHEEDFWSYIHNVHGTGKKTTSRSSRDKEYTHGSLGFTTLYSIGFTDKVFQPGQVDLNRFYYLEKFFDKYVYGCLRGEPICIAELLSRPLFNPFMDLDFKEAGPIKKSSILSACSVIARTLSTFFPELLESPVCDAKPNVKKYSSLDPETAEWTGAGEGFSRLCCIISISDPKVSEKDGKIYNQVGCHINWPGRIPVTPDEMKAIVRTCVNKLECVFPRKGDGLKNSWDEVIDIGPYKGDGGMRMVMSKKAEVCKYCTGTGKASESSKQSCHVCKGDRMILVDRCYYPSVMLNGKGEIMKNVDWILQEPSVYVRACSLRSSLGLNSKRYYVESPDTPPDLSKKSISLQRALGVKQQPNVTYVDSLEECGVGKNYAPGSEQSAIIMDIIRSINIEWEELTFVSLKRINRLTYALNVNGEKSSLTYCLNKAQSGTGTNHTSSFIWFQIQINGIIQRCRSQKYGCKQYKSKKFPLPDNLKILLFEDVVGQNPTYQKEFVDRMLTANSQDKNVFLSKNKALKDSFFNQEVRNLVMISAIRNPVEHRRKNIEELKANKPSLKSQRKKQKTMQHGDFPQSEKTNRVLRMQSSSNLEKRDSSSRHCFDSGFAIFQ